MIAPKAAAPFTRLSAGAIALPQGLLFLEASQTLIAADVHLGYEDVVGAALPLWSTAEILATLEGVVDSTHAAELVLLGDIIHGTRMSEGASRKITDGLNALRERCRLTLIAGNHEGRSRGKRVLGETEDAVERDGWLLVHGDEPVAAPRSIVGHFHPSIVFGGDRSVPVFLASKRTIVLPAMTPYSRGLDVLSSACTRALKPLVAPGEEIAVVACGEGKVYPFGSLAALRALLRAERI